MASMSLLAAVCGGVLAGASFFFALAETALFSLGKWQARRLVERSPQRGGLVARLLGSPQDLLATIVLGNTCANAGLVTVGLWMVLRGEWSPVVTPIVVLLVILVGGEVIPKTLAVRAPESWSLRVARPMLFVLAATRPARQVAQRLNQRLLDWLIPKSIRPPSVTTAEDYAELLDLAYQQGALAESEREIILQILSMDRRTAGDVMRPRARMDCLPDDLPVAEMIQAARQFKHRRLPLYDDTPDTIVGVLNTRVLLLDPQVDLAEAIEFPSFVPESMNLLQLFKSLQRQQRGLAIVLDEFGSTAGLVTMEDILGAMIGRIRGEGEAEGFVMEKLGPGRWRVSGTMRLEDFRREYPALGEVAEVDTMGGLMVCCAAVVPTPGQSVVFGGLRLTATAADERRVRELLVETLKKGETAT
jgi:CBS domain containing-hemolysin-like protein